MLIPVILFIIGLLCLIKGGDWFVDGASALARRFHLPELLIGATVVSIGTTLPEVMVSTMSAVSGHGEIAYGNAIGSVICNAALIAAITIAVRPGKVDRKRWGCQWRSSLRRQPSTAWQPTALASSPGLWASSCWPCSWPIWWPTCSR